MVRSQEDGGTRTKETKEERACHSQTTCLLLPVVRNFEDPPIKIKVDLSAFIVAN